MIETRPHMTKMKCNKRDQCTDDVLYNIHNYISRKSIGEHIILLEYITIF